MHTRLHEYTPLDMNRLPAFLHRHPDGPTMDRSPWLSSNRPVSRDARMEADASTSRELIPARGRDMDVASSLTTLAGGSVYSQRQPASPAWSHSSLASDGTNTSFKSDFLSSVDGLSEWPSPMTAGSNSSPSSNDNGDRSLPRLPELDLISLETLASHFARSSADSRRNSAETLTSRPHLETTHPANPYRRPCRTPTPLPPMSSPHRVNKPKRNPPARGTRCNVKYTIEQKDFIDYWRIDRHDRETPWDDVVREYNAQFKGPHRRNGGLQSAYYRENKKIPVADREGLLVFDENDEVKTVEVPVRDAKGRLHSIKSIGLLSTHPERALQYSWVSREHKRKVWRVGHARQAQLDASMQRQRRRAELDARLARGPEQHSATATENHAFRPMELDAIADAAAATSPGAALAQRASGSVMCRL